MQAQYRHVEAIQVRMDKEEFTIEVNCSLIGMEQRLDTFDVIHVGIETTPHGHFKNSFVISETDIESFEIKYGVDKSFMCQQFNDHTNPNDTEPKYEFVLMSESR